MTYAPPASTVRMRGFNLIEVMVTVSIIGIASAITLPALGNMRQKSQAQSVSADMVAAMTMARTEALRRNTPIQVVANGDWSQGWCVKVRELHTLSSGDTLCNQDAALIKTFAAPEGVASISGHGAAVTYFANGSLVSGSVNQPVNLRICQKDGSGSVVSVALAGSVQANRISTGC